MLMLSLWLGRHFVFVCQKTAGLNFGTNTSLSFNTRSCIAYWNIIIVQGVAKLSVKMKLVIFGNLQCWQLKHLYFICPTPFEILIWNLVQSCFPTWYICVQCTASCFFKDSFLSRNFFMFCHFCYFFSNAQAF